LLNKTIPYSFMDGPERGATGNRPAAASVCGD
jgi:hypothetical protein